MIAKRYVIWCDGCTEYMSTVCNTANEIREFAKGYGWVTKGNKHYCSSCSK